VPDDGAFVVQLACKSLAPWNHQRAEEWLRGWDWKTCRTIAGAGGLDVLMLVREQGCMWDEDTCEAAAGEGHLELLKWAIENAWG
jgi:hypothetical protein